MLPGFNEHGLLPVGIHGCTWSEFCDSFATNPHRAHLCHGLHRLRLEVLQAQHLIIPLLIDGSFVRDKDYPEDIDVLLDLTGVDASTFQRAVTLCARRQELKAEYHVELFPHHPDFPHDFPAFFQYVGIKAAGDLRLDPKHLKGIVRIAP